MTKEIFGRAAKKERQIIFLFLRTNVDKFLKTHRNIFELENLRNSLKYNSTKNKKTASLLKFRSFILVRVQHCFLRRNLTKKFLRFSSNSKDSQHLQLHDFSFLDLLSGWLELNIFGQKCGVKYLTFLVRHENNNRTSIENIFCSSRRKRVFSVSLAFKHLHDGHLLDFWRRFPLHGSHKQATLLAKI